MQKKRQVSIFPLLASMAFLGGLTGLLVKDPDTRFIVTILVLFASVVVVNWIETR